MAEKELRKMNRTELIEIIYALQQNEKTLRGEIAELRRQLDDRILRLDHAGSIAEAALSLNHLFEDAQRAAEQYLLSVTGKPDLMNPQADEANRAGLHKVEVMTKSPQRKSFAAQDFVADHPTSQDEMIQETEAKSATVQEATEQNPEAQAPASGDAQTKNTLKSRKKQRGRKKSRGGAA